MGLLLRSEFRKLRTTRTALWLLAGMVFLAGPGIFLAGQGEVAQLAKPLHEQVWFLIAAGFTRLLVVILGIRSITDELRFGTLVPTALVQPRRSRIIAAKALSVGAAGLVFTVISELVMLGCAVLLTGSKGADFTVTSETISALAGMALAGGLWAVIGVGLGAAIRNQIIAIVGSLLWLMPGGGFEDLLKEYLGRAGDYLPGNVGLALALSPQETSFLLMSTVLLLYAGAVLFGSTWLIARRDI